MCEATELTPIFLPMQKVLDVGCGTGIWAM